MTTFLDSISAVVLDRNARELIGALLVGLVVALLSRVAFLVARRTCLDQETLQCGVLLFASLSSMAFAAGYVHFEATTSNPSANRLRPAPRRMAFVPPPGLADLPAPRYVAARRCAVTFCMRARNGRLTSR